MTIYNDINKVLRLYFDTLYYCDLKKFDMVFHEQAIYVTADETKPLFRNMDTYRKCISKRKPPSSSNEPRKDYIDSIEIAGENTARARVRCSIGTRNFVDFLTLIRDQNQWRIIAKVFQISEN